MMATQSSSRLLGVFNIFQHVSDHSTSILNDFGYRSLADMSCTLPKQAAQTSWLVKFIGYKRDPQSGKTDVIALGVQMPSIGYS